jgi:hypothetical protein
MDERTTSLPSQAITWSSVSSVPALLQFELPMKEVVKQILIEVDGTYDQSVGAETIATEGNIALFDEFRVNLQGTLRRQFKAGMLYELNRLNAGAAGPQTDPAAGVASGKVFNAAYIFDMGVFDTLMEFSKQRNDLIDLQAQTYLDLRNWPGKVYFEVVPRAFNNYVSGNTQANMTCTVRVTVLSLPTYRRISIDDQRHCELVLQDTVDMSVSKTDAFSNLLRDGVKSRGVLVKVGTLAATPNILAYTALSLIGLRGTFKSGPAVTWKDKIRPATYQRLAGWDRVWAQTRTGYAWLDHSSDKSAGGFVNGDKLSVYQPVYDITGTASTTMQVGQLVVRP